MSENTATDNLEITADPVESPPANRLAETLAMLRLMTQDALLEHKGELLELPEVHNHLQMIDRYLFNAAVEEQRSREPAPEPKNLDLPDLPSLMAPGEKYMLRTLAKAPNGVNKHMLGNENARLFEWDLIVAEGDVLKLTDRGAQVNHLMSLKPNQRHAAHTQAQALVS